MSCWYTGKYLRIILDKNNIIYETGEINQKALQLLGGGRSLSIYLWTIETINKNNKPEPLNPNNPLIITPGSLVGSPLSTASKTSFTARSPLTGLLGRSMTGGRIGLEIKALGYDALVITGSLEKPGILIVDSKGARIEPGEEIWGQTISIARKRLQERHPGYSITLIGPAGEHLSKISMIDVDGRQAGRTGLGAVLGSKNVKAILVKGSRKPSPCNREKALLLARELNRLTREHKASKALVEYGSAIMAEYTGRALGIMPGLNWAKSSLEWCTNPDKAVEELARFAPRMRTGRRPCIGCGRPCSQVVRTREGETDGPEYETTYSLGTDLGICRAEDIAWLNKLADELGFDTISAGATIAWAIDMGSRGRLEEAPAWGDVEGIARLLVDMAYRRGKLGSLLADGTAAAVEKIGGLDRAILVKKMEPPGYDVRGLKGMALGYAVSSRGADHLTSGVYAVEIPGSLWRFKGIDRLAYEGKGVLVKIMEDLMGFYDSTGICKFSRYTLNPENTSEFYEAVTGIETSPGGLLRIGERTVNIERLVNLWLGLDPLRDDWLPERLLKEAISDGPSKGEVVDPQMLSKMRSEYYASRGWSPTGRPLYPTITELELDEILPRNLLDLASDTLG